MQATLLALLALTAVAPAAPVDLFDLRTMSLTPVVGSGIENELELDATSVSAKTPTWTPSIAVPTASASAVSAPAFSKPKVTASAVSAPAASAPAASAPAAGAGAGVAHGLGAAAGNVVAGVEGAAGVSVSQNGVGVGAGAVAGASAPLRKRRLVKREDDLADEEAAFAAEDDFEADIEARSTTTLSLAPGVTKYQHLSHNSLGDEYTDKPKRNH